MSDPLSILVHLRWHFQFASDVIAGLSASQGSPALSLTVRNGDAPLESNVLDRIAPQAVIGDSHYTGTAELCRERGIPFIDLTGSGAAEGVHRILPDDEAIGRMAADYLRESGFAHFAFVGFSDQGYSQRRGEGFVRALGTAYPVKHFASPLEPDIIGQTDPAILSFLSILPRPAGIFACSDLRALSVTTALPRLRRRIPEHAVVLGVDVDRALQRMFQLQIPSIDQAAWFQGWQAGQLVRQLLSDKPPAPQTLRMPPLRVVDPLTSQAGHPRNALIDTFLRALDRHHAHPNALAHAFSEVPISRRALEGRTRRILGATPLELLHRRRRKAALELLARPGLSLGDVAEKTGFPFQGDFSRFMKNAFGVPPGVIRHCLRQCR